MDLYNTILINGGQILQDGSAWRSLASKDGSKIIQQFATKTGNTAVDVYEAATNKLISSSRKMCKEDGSWISRALNYAKGSTRIFALQKLGEKENNSFMSVFFKYSLPKTAPSVGEFMHVVQNELQKKGRVTYMPINKSIMTADPKISSRVNIFNSKFGKIE